eukprot:5237664-Prymnesium_polylepis.2
MRNPIESMSAESKRMIFRSSSMSSSHPVSIVRCTSAATSHPVRGRAHASNEYNHRRLAATSANAIVLGRARTVVQPASGDRSRDSAA